jgi:hypothetical protein
MPDAGVAGAAAHTCPRCGTEVAASLLACPSCHALTHAEALKGLAAQAESAERGGDITGALTRWRAALDLLPETTKQHATIAQRVAGLSRQVDSGPRPGPGAPAAG